MDLWEKIKQESKGQTTQAEAVKSVPKTFPALMRAQKVQKPTALLLALPWSDTQKTANGF